MFDGDYRVYSTRVPLAKLVFLHEAKTEKAYSGEDITIVFITPSIKTRNGFFKLSLKKEVRENKDKECNKIAFFTVVKIANADSSSVDAIPLFDRVQRFEISNFDNNKNLLKEIDQIFKKNFL
ncbi:MAG: hypothetical protein K1060chlam3_00761 [Candidatus Anoxychlamydiales bacterium]|nr:hypothetical protein [Candidatus Anoxychlamydiales bacterium]